MKAAVSIPDEIFRAADREARRLGISRSELVTRALRMLLASERAESVTKSYDLAFGDADDAAEPLESTDAAVRRAARRTLLSVEW